ncbi:fimbrial protein, partial [Escherichia coli]|nr:fimbrial protein [Escherichia coli]
MTLRNKYGYLFSTLILASLLYLPNSHSSILDGGEVQFNGFVTDEAPKWTWQISTPDQRWAV